MTKELIIEAKDVFYKLGNKFILNNINLTIAKGSIVTLIGPNGSGKTTLVKILLGIIKPDNGKVNIDKKIKIGYMPQKVVIDKNLPLTVKSFLKLDFRINLTKQHIYDIANEIGISKLLENPIQEISGGELQKVLLAKSIINNPDLLVLDEPVQGIDITGQIEFYNLIKRLKNKNNMSILMVSHDLYMVMKATDHVFCLNHHICCEGTAADVSNNKAYKELFGEKTLNTLAVYSHDHDHTHDISEN